MIGEEKYIEIDYKADFNPYHTADTPRVFYAKNSPNDIDN